MIKLVASRKRGPAGLSGSAEAAFLRAAFLHTAVGGPGAGADRLRRMLRAGVRRYGTHDPTDLAWAPPTPRRRRTR